MLAEGSELGPAELGVLASLAVSHPLVFRQPRVAILGSGDEIVDVDQREEILSGRKTASSNTHTLMAMVRRAGAEPVNLGIARDTPESLREHLARALDADLLVTTAGISVGEHDHLRSVLDRAGRRAAFLEAQDAARRAGRIRAAPGRPVDRSARQPRQHDGHVRAVRPAGHPQDGRPPPALPAHRSRFGVAEPVRLKPRLQHFLRAVVSEGPDGPEARLTGPQGSGILTSMIAANALLVIPEGQFETPAGSTARALRLRRPGPHRRARLLAPHGKSLTPRGLREGGLVRVSAR